MLQVQKEGVQSEHTDVNGRKINYHKILLNLIQYQFVSLQLMLKHTMAQITATSFRNPSDCFLRACLKTDDTGLEVNTSLKDFGNYLPL